MPRFEKEIGNPLGEEFDFSSIEAYEKVPYIDKDCNLVFEVEKCLRVSLRQRDGEFFKMVGKVLQSDVADYPVGSKFGYMAFSHDKKQRASMTAQCLSAILNKPIEEIMENGKSLVLACTDDNAAAGNCASLKATVRPTKTGGTWTNVMFSPAKHP